MRRAPRFSRSRRRDRRRRLARLAGIVVGVFVGLSILGRLLDPADERAGTFDQIRFVGVERAEGSPTRGDEDATRAAAAEIRDFLDDWYTAGFADPGGDPSMPEIAERFVGDAALGFVEDRAALTLGDLAERVVRLDVVEQRANVVVYFEEGAARAATAAVAFGARATLRDADDPVELKQRITLVLEPRDGAWVVTNYYDATHRQRSMPEEPA